MEKESSQYVEKCTGYPVHPEEYRNVSRVSGDATRKEQHGAVFH